VERYIKETVKRDNARSVVPRKQENKKYHTTTTTSSFLLPPSSLLNFLSILPY
jgi:hypothetical protein